MKIYQNMPRELVDDWPTRIVRHAGGTQVDFHYHEVDEWLEVLRWEICFVSAGGVEYPLFEGEALNIPQGEVHRVQIGPNGVKYTMWLPVEVPDKDFSKKLAAKDISLIEKNLAVPKAENSGDRAFFKDFLAEELTFRAASGAVLVGKKAFLDRSPAEVTRDASDSVRILHRTKSPDPENILLSTVVHTQPKVGGPRSSFTNLRLFIIEGDIWKCRVWINYPETRVA